MASADRPSLGRELFSRIDNGDSISMLRAMVESEPKAVENEWIEFKAYPWRDFLDPMKGCEPKNLKDPTRDFIKETWSELLAAFANTQGGILIWGIHAAKNRDGIDEAKKFQMVPNPKALASRLTELHHEATDPPIMGVRILPLTDPIESDGKGFVVCYVPESIDSPHRARFKGEQFYYRSLDKSVVMPIPMLRRMFYPQYNPRFEAESSLRGKRITNQSSLVTAMVNVEIILHNEGRATAKNPYVVMKHNIEKDFRIALGGNWQNVATQHMDRSFESKSSIHPGASTNLFNVDIETQVRIIDGVRGDDHCLPKFPPMEFTILVYAENYQENPINIRIIEEDFESCKMIQNKRYRPLPEA